MSSASRLRNRGDTGLLKTSPKISLAAWRLGGLSRSRRQSSAHVSLLLNKSVSSAQPNECPLRVATRRVTCARNGRTRPSPLAFARSYAPASVFMPVGGVFLYYRQLAPAHA